ncbi:MAG: electron transfer flavoprotein subunit beta/FixA family protein, partial [Legionellales bacterium]|nr:electron transfer flavoprotein subunit beta/FixA family protein [Legionellales bacterium]
MKILVCLKQVLNPYAKVFPDDTNKVIRSNNTRYVINPFDEIAIEEAVRLKEQYNCEIIALSIGSPEIQESLRKALAIGADRGVL